MGEPCDGVEVAEPKVMGLLVVTDGADGVVGGSLVSFWDSLDWLAPNEKPPAGTWKVGGLGPVNVLGALPSKNVCVDLPANENPPLGREGRAARSCVGGATAGVSVSFFSNVSSWADSFSGGASSGGGASLTTLLALSDAGSCFCSSGTAGFLAGVRASVLKADDVPKDNAEADDVGAWPDENAEV